jgi:DNA segregation ATPase FtsK/SpoIIIE-like protein
MYVGTAPTNKHNAGNTPGMKKKKKNRGKSRNAIMTYGLSSDKENASNRKQEEADASVGKQSVALPAGSPEPAHSTAPTAASARATGSWLQTLGLATLAAPAELAEEQEAAADEEEGEPAAAAAAAAMDGKSVSAAVAAAAEEEEEEEEEQQQQQQEEADVAEAAEVHEPPQFRYASTMPETFNGSVVVLDFASSTAGQTTAHAVSFRPARASLRSRRHWTGQRPTVTRLALNPECTDYGSELVVVPPSPAAPAPLEAEEEEFCEAGVYDCGLAIGTFFRRLFRLP